MIHASLGPYWVKKQAVVDPAWTDLLWAQFESPSYSDNLGNWIYVLDEYVDENSTFLIDTSNGGSPASSVGSLNLSEGGRRFYLQHADNRLGGSSYLGNAEDFNTRDFRYSVYVKIPDSQVNDMNLGGFNAGGAASSAQTIFSLNYYYYGPEWEIELRINDENGTEYLYAPLFVPNPLQWYKIEITMISDNWSILVDNVSVASIQRYSTFIPSNLINFAIDKTYSFSRYGWVDEPRLSYRNRT